MSYKNEMKLKIFPSKSRKKISFKKLDKNSFKKIIIKDLLQPKTCTLKKCHFKKYLQKMPIENPLQKISPKIL